MSVSLSRASSCLDKVVFLRASRQRAQLGPSSHISGAPREFLDARRQRSHEALGWSQATGGGRHSGIRRNWTGLRERGKRST